MLIRLVHRFSRHRYKALGLQSQFVQLKGCTLHVHTHRHATSRKTALLLHGLGTSSSTWVGVMAEVLSTHQVVAPDLAGFGFSELHPPRRFFTLSEHEESLNQLLETMSVKPSVIVGHSLGGWLAARLAAHMGDGLDHLVLIDTAGVFYAGAEELRNDFTIRTSADIRRLTEKMWYRYPWYFKPFRRAIRKDLLRRAVPDLVHAVKRSDFLDALYCQLTMPVTLIWGANDRLIPLEAARLMKERVSHARLIVLEKCGHVPQLEQPKALRDILRQLLSEYA
jgi:abhydrolase domain-containing protein 6